MKAPLDTGVKIEGKRFTSFNYLYIRFSTLNTRLSHELIKNQLVDLIENVFRHEEVL